MDVKIRHKLIEIEDIVSDNLNIDKSPPLVIKHPKACLITISFYFIKTRAATAAEEMQTYDLKWSHPVKYL